LAITTLEEIIIFLCWCLWCETCHSNTTDLLPVTSH